MIENSETFMTIKYIIIFTEENNENRREEVNASLQEIIVLPHCRRGGIEKAFGEQ